MTESENQRLRETLQDVAAKVRRYQTKRIGEQNTKASLIEPVLEALGWDIRDFEEVHREYKAKPQDRPVDYALKLLRQARLFIEAKGLDENLADRKWISQILGYATVAGVAWCVLSDGDRYRFYNATAAVDAEEKLFCEVKLRNQTNVRVSLSDVIGAGFLSPPLKLFRRYRKTMLEATLLLDGTAEFEGKAYRSSSEAAGIARGTITGRPMSTNGWSLWQYRDEANAVRELDYARQAYLQKQGESC